MHTASRDCKTPNYDLSWTLPTIFEEPANIDSKFGQWSDPTPPSLVYQHTKYQIQIIFSSITTNYQPHNTRLTSQTSSVQRISNHGLFALRVCTLCKLTCLHLGQHCQLPQTYKVQWLAYFLSSLSAHQVNFYEVDHYQLSSNWTTSTFYEEMIFTSLQAFLLLVSVGSLLYLYVSHIT